MAVSWITVLTVAMAMTLTLVQCEEYTTVSPERQAELEKLDKSLDSNDENALDFSGDVDPDLENAAKANKSMTTPTVETTKQDRVQDTEAVGGVFTSAESVETTTESQEGSGDVDLFPNNVQHALNETQDKEFLPASDATTAGTTEGRRIPVRPQKIKPAQSRPKDRQTDTTEHPTSAEPKNDTEVVVPAKVPEVKSKLSSNVHDVNEAEQLESTSASSKDNPSAQATKGGQPLSRGLIVGIVIIGVVILLALIILLVYLLVFRPRRKSLKHDVSEPPQAKENGTVANGAPKNNEESMTALVKDLKENKLSSGKGKTYGTELKDDMEDVKLNGTANTKSDSPV